MDAQPSKNLKNAFGSVEGPVEEIRSELATRLQGSKCCFKGDAHQWGARLASPAYDGYGGRRGRFGFPGTGDGGASYVLRAG